MIVGSELETHQKRQCVHTRTYSAKAIRTMCRSCSGQCFIGPKPELPQSTSTVICWNGVSSCLRESATQSNVLLLGVEGPERAVPSRPAISSILVAKDVGVGEGDSGS